MSSECPSVKKNRRIADAISTLRSIEQKKGSSGTRAPQAHALATKPNNRRRVKIRGKNGNTYSADMDDNGTLYIADSDELFSTELMQTDGDDTGDKNTTHAASCEIVPNVDLEPATGCGNDFFDTFEASAADNTDVAFEPKAPSVFGYVGTAISCFLALAHLCLSPLRFANQMRAMIFVMITAFASGSSTHAAVYTYNALALASPDCALRNRSCSAYGHAIIDSGTTCTASPERSLFPTAKIKKYNPGYRVRVASGVHLPVEFVGTLELRIPAKQITGNISTSASDLVLSIDDAFYVPGLCATLVSTKALFKNHRIRTYLNDELHLRLPRGRKINIDEGPRNYTIPYVHAVSTQQFDANSASTRTDKAPPSSELLHSRLCHFSYDKINASKDHVRGLPHSLPRSDCRACTTGGTRAPTVSTSTTRQYKYFGERVASDLCEMPVSTPFGFKYFISFYDLATKYLNVYYLRHGNAEEVQACFELFLADNKRYLKGKAVTWFTDNGSEFHEKNLTAFIRELQVRHRATVPHNPQTNPAERVNSILLRPVRILLAASNASEACWPWAVNQIVYVHNALITRSDTAVDALPPYTLRSRAVFDAHSATTNRDERPDVSRLRVMFCRVQCYLRGDAQERSKLEPRLADGVHLGIDQRRGGYFVFIPSLNRLTTIRFGDTIFYENEFPELKYISGTYVSYITRYSLPSVEQQQAMNQSTMPTTTTTTTTRDPDRSPGDRDHGEQGDQSDGPPSRRLRSTGHVPDSTGLAAIMDIYDAHALGYIPVTAFDENKYVCLNLTNATDVLPPPRNVGEIDGRPDAKEWWAALRHEYEGKVKNGTFVLVKRQPGMKILKTKLVMTNKCNVDHTLAERKGRWVGCGYAQSPLVHYDKTYQATAKSTSIRIFFLLLAYYDLEGAMVDAIKAYTQAKLDREIYCEQMPGFVQCDPETKQPYVCKLIKALEGLKQAGYLWQQQTFKFMTEKAGFTQMWCEPCLFYKKNLNDIIIALIWVDDFAIGYNNRKVFDEFYNAYSKQFNAKLINGIEKFVGLTVTRDRARREITLTQTDLIEKIAGKFFPNPSVLKTVHAPAWFTDKAERTNTYSNLHLATTDADNALKKGKPYLSLVASLLYISTMTMPHISYHVAQLCRYMSAPSDECYQRAEELLSYVYHTRGMGIKYGGTEIQIPDLEGLAGKVKIDKGKFESNMGLHAFSDASWKTDNTYAGHVIKANNASVDWSSKLLKVKASSSEAEISAGCLATKRLNFVRNVMSTLMGLFDMTIDGAIPLFIDNSAAIELSENMGVSKKTEHFQRWQHTMRDETLRGAVKPIFVRTKWQLADILTKVTPRNLYWTMRDLMINRTSTSTKATVMNALKALRLS